MLKRVWVVAIALLVAATSVQAVMAVERGPRPDRGPKVGPADVPLGAGPLVRAMEQLDLTPEQRQAAKTILQAHRQEVREAQKALLDARTALENAVAAGDEAEVRDAANAFGSAVANAAVLRAKVWKEIKATLTPEQQAKAEELRGALRRSIEEGRWERLEQRRREKGKSLNSSS